MANARNYERADSILRFICTYRAEHGFGPTVREIGMAVGLSSTSTVAKYLERMAQEGVITYKPGVPRSVRGVTVG